MAQTLLDQVVTSYPKRVDVWAQYIDMLVKSEMVDSARFVIHLKEYQVEILIIIFFLLQKRSRTRHHSENTNEENAHYF